MSLGLQGAFGAVGGQRALDKVLEDRLLAQKLAEDLRAREFAQQQQVEAGSRAERGLGLQERGVGLAEQRFGLEQSTAEQEAAAKAAEGEQRQMFLGSLPAHLQPVAQAKQFGINISPDDFEDPAAARAREDAKVAQQQANTDRSFGLQQRGLALQEGAQARAETKQTADLQAKSQQEATERAALAESAGKTLSVIDQLIDETGHFKPGVSPIVGRGGPLIGAGATMIGGSEVANKQVALNRLKSRMIVDLMAEMKSQSATGATGFGQLNREELKVITDAASQLDQAQTEEQMQGILVQMRDSIGRVRDAAALGRPGRTGAPAPAGAPAANDPLGLFGDN